MIIRKVKVTEYEYQAPINYVAGATEPDIQFQLTDYEIPSGATGRVYVGRSDGTFEYTVATISGNNVTVAPTSSMFSVKGPGAIQVTLYVGNEVVKNFAIPVYVHADLADDSAEAGSDVTGVFRAAEEEALADFAEDAEAKAAEVIESIPADYTELTEEVTQLNERMDSEIATLHDDVNTYVGTFVQGVRYTSAPSVIVNANNRCTSVPIEMWKGDIIRVDSIPSGFRVALVSDEGKEASWTTGVIQSDATQHGYFYLNVSTSDGVSLITPNDFSLSFKITDKSTRIYALEALEADVAGIETNISALEAHIDNTDSVLYTRKTDVPWEIGNITISNDGWTYWTTPSLTRIRTPEGKQLSLTKGSIVKLSDYTNARFICGWRVNGEYNASTGWITSGEFIVPVTGEYVFLISNKTEATLTNVTALAQLFVLQILGNSEVENQIENFNFGMETKFLVPASPKFAMHRGYSTNAPENTNAAFTLAGQAGAWAIETDIHETTDGHFVCFHDNDVARMTDGTGNINEMTLAQVEALTIDAGNHVEDFPNEKIPTVEEFLGICRRYGCIALLEWKYIIHEDKLVQIVKNYGMEQSVIFLVGAASTCTRLRLYTNAPCALLGFDNSDDAVIINNASTVPNCFADIVHYRINSNDLPALAHSLNIPLMVYTVNNEATAEALFKIGVDVVATDSIPKFT